MRYSKKWVNLYNQANELKQKDYNLILRGMHYVLTSAFNLRDLKTHQTYLSNLESFRNDNYSNFTKTIKYFLSYIYIQVG